MRASTSASQACGSTSLSFAVVISVVMAAARSAPRSEPAKSHDFLAKRKTSERPLGGVVRQADPAVVEEAGKAVPAPEHVVDRLDDGGRARQPGAFIAQPRFQRRPRSGALCSCRTRRRSSALRPLMSRSMSNSRSMRLTASSAIGEIGRGVCRAVRWRRCRRVRRTAAVAWDQQSADVIAPRARDGS